ncbi:MAG: putative Ras family GTPase [Streblomastix strix]|uniref:Putative Ras family GTPase n=1 Tax=Streblomastix strix TaxID=222440 RepID=A0A5J4VMK4_9EUKA|nr:MAG: putative Ras family GTPase [Streblomastix strix]
MLAAPPPLRQRFRIKVISMGEPGVGKSCLIKRYCEKKFVSKYISTIGIDFGMKPVMVDSLDVRVNLFDLAGGDHYLEIRNEFYKEAEGAILVFDVNSKSSFVGLEKWLDEAQKYGAKDYIAILCGNKTDIKKRVVSEQEAQSWASSKGFRYFETSANTGDGVDQAFTFLINTVAQKCKPPH